MKRSRVIGVISLFFMAIVIGAVILVFRSPDFGKSLPKNFPKDIPIIAGDIISCKTSRSDDLVKVLIISIQTKESFKDTVEFYKEEFKKKATKELNEPNFAINGPYGNEVVGIGVFGKNQVVVTIKANGEVADVLVQVRGTSIFFLPR